MPSLDATRYQQGEMGNGRALVLGIRDLESLASNDTGRFYLRAYRYLRNTHDAEDAVQDAFLSAYQHLSDFKGRAQLSTWFTTIVINSALMHVRRRRHSRSSSDQQLSDDPEDIIFLEALPDHRPSPEEVCNSAEVNRILRRAIDQLSPRLRRVAHICLLDGLKATEAAEALGIPSGTVKTQLFRARARITRSVRNALSSQLVKRR